MTRRKVRPRPLPPGWSVSTSTTIHGRQVLAGTELSCRRYRSRVKFVHRVDTPNASWLQCWRQGWGFVFIDPAEVRTVHYKRRLLR